MTKLSEKKENGINGISLDITILPNKATLIFVAVDRFKMSWGKGYSIHESIKNLKTYGGKPTHINIYLVYGDKELAWKEITIDFFTITYKTDNCILLSQTPLKQEKQPKNKK